MRCIWQGYHQLYGHIRCIYTVSANPTHVSAVDQTIRDGQTSLDANQHTNTITHTLKHTSKYTHAHTTTYTQIHTQAHTHTYIHVHTETHTYTHVYTQSHTHTLTPHRLQKPLPQTHRQWHRWSPALRAHHRLQLQAVPGSCRPWPDAQKQMKWRLT